MFNLLNLMYIYLWLVNFWLICEWLNPGYIVMNVHLMIGYSRQLYFFSFFPTLIYFINLFVNFLFDGRVLPLTVVSSGRA